MPDDPKPSGQPSQFRLPPSKARVQKLIDQEFRFHIEERIEGLMADGMSREQADAEMQSRFGDYRRYREETRGIDEGMVRQRNRLDVIDSLRRGLRLGARTLLRTPGFSVLAVTTLALGIGATTAIYSVLDAVVLQELPFPAPDELIALKHPAEVPGTGTTKWGLSAAGYHYVQIESRTLADVGAFQTYETTVINEGDALRAPAAQVTASLMRVLGFTAVIGRTIIPSDDVPDAEYVVVLSYGAWQTRFGANPAVVGQVIDLAGLSARIVGVMNRGAVLPHIDVGASGNTGGAMWRADFWTPLRLDPNAPPVNSHFLRAVGRLKPGVTPAAAQADFAQLTARFPEIFPNAYDKAFMDNYHFGSAATPLREDVVGSTQRILWIVLSAVLVVFVIAATNVANLFLVRTEVRRRETGIRSALGAGRRQLAMHYLGESLLLTTMAGLLGLFLAALGLKVLIAVAPEGLPRLDEVHVGWRALLLALSMAVACGIVFGLFPLSGHVQDVVALKDGGRAATISRTRRRLRSALVMGQVALALVLLASAGLMVRSMLRLHAVQPGFDATGALAIDLPLSYTRYRSYDDVERFHRLLDQRIAALPAVQSVGVGTAVPLEESMGTCATTFAEGRIYNDSIEPPCAKSVLVGPGYFAALGIRVRGRAPTWADLDGQTGAVVITRALADRFWPGEEPIGKGLRPNGPQPPYFRVVGVVEVLHGTGLERPPTEAVFYPLKPVPGTMLWGPPRSTALVVRSALADPSALTASIRQVLSEIDPRVPLANVRTMETVVRDSTARSTFIMILLGIAAIMALLLSAVGLYGVISYVVAQRRPEIGVRMALGARIGQVSSMVVRESLRLTITGIALGVGASLVVNRLLATLLFEISPHDPLTLVAVSALLLAIATAASLVPARRASRVDPIEILREA